MRLLISLLFPLLIWSSVSHAEIDPTPKTLDELKEAIEQIRKKTNTPAVGIALVNKDGPLWVAGLGEADTEKHNPADENTLFRIGSVSKMIIALAALQLIEEGKLSLDDRLAELAPEIKFDNPWENTNPIKIVHLLEHTSGWDNSHPRELTLEVNANTPLLEILNFHPHSRHSRWAPGTYMAYNNTGPVVIAYLIEKISGQSFSDYVKNKIFTDLGMNSTSYFPQEIPPNSQAQLYTQGVPTEFMYDATWPAGALLSSPKDMAKLLQFFVAEERNKLNISDASIKRMETPGTTKGAQQGMKTGYSLGNYTSSDVDLPILLHGHRGTVAGSLTELFYSREHGVGYAFMMNEMNTAYPQISKLLRIYLQQYLSATPLTTVKNTTEIATQINPINDIEGIYAPTAPSSAYSSFGEQLFGMIKIVNTGNQWLQQPFLGGAPRLLSPKSNQTFIDQETGQDAIAVISAPSDKTQLEVNGYTGNNTYQKVSAARAYGQWVIITLLVACVIIYALYVIVSAVKKLLRSQQQTSLIALTMPGLSILLFITYYYLSGKIAYNMHEFGKPSTLSIGLLLTSIAWPASLIYNSFLLFITRLYANTKLLAINTATLIATQITLCTIMACYGLIAIPTWL